ncbi:ribosome quality control complex subunit NEMF-like [Panonychus citri]|uniref:ribosome quality control complex subunit NEMF-like n=1 Tax=Panonychus citri TaxID=50023 RepID=UPI0023073E51|nr:ribosome quality control complex subunit NEMF-like [Panonychus citri]
MKNRFTTLDIVSIIPELHRMLKGYRVHQVYDVDAKTYLIKLKDNPNEETPEINKLVLLIESGIRLHVSEYNWPKHSGVSGFTLKLRKHLRNKRIEYIKQVGIDRVVDIQFGINEAAYHIIIELYDKGNVIITDHQYVILNLLRSRKPGENDDVKVMVREVYPLQTAIVDYKLPNKSEIISLVQSANPGDTLRKIFNPRLIFGTALLEHCFMEVGFPENWKLDSTKNADYDKIEEALRMASNLLDLIVDNSNGIIIHKEEISQANDGTKLTPVEPKTVITYTEFHPMLFNQHKGSTKLKYIEFESFGKAVDIYFSSIEGQKIDQRALQQEKEALKKLENVKKDHEKRLLELASLQEADKRKASLIEMNKDLVEKALLIMRSAIANQISWEEIKALIKEAQLRDDLVACSIKGLKLEKNQFTMLLVDPFDEDESTRLQDLVDIDLDLSAFANARRYYDQKRYAAKKTQKTLESSSKALKSAEHRTQQALKEVAIKTSITKARKVLWFEKFFWFISSENYLVIGGRDAQQNELIVKKYLTQGDIYVHADLHGASSIVIKNYIPGEPIPPKTLTEAGIMAVCYSNAWENKFSSRSWWVHSHQVSKTAPSGEYLTVGAFMIRGKKNYLPMAQLVMGFGFVFRLDEESIERHKLMDRRTTTDYGDVVEINSKIRDSINEDNSEEDVDNDDRDEDNTFPDIKIKNITQTIGKSDYNDYDDDGERDHNKMNNNKEEDQEEGDDEQVAITGSQVPRMKFQVNLKKKRNEGKKVSTKQTATQQQQQQQQQDSTSKQQSNQQQVKDKNNKNQPLKRGQRYKLKKMKEKYKDQDEEDRIFKLAWIGSTQINRKMEDPGQLEDSDGVNKDHHQPNNDNDDEQSSFVIIGRTGENNNNEVEGGGGLEREKQQEEREKETSQERGKEEITTISTTNTTTTTIADDNDDDEEEEGEEDDEQKQHQEEEEEDEDDEEEGSSNKMIEHVNLMNSLTGQPMADDVLLYTIPVVAPYSALSSYKFKVKVFPGTSKRGKSAKTALSWFQADKMITQREKDLLKNAKDQDISRNLPNKVKILPVKLNTTVRRKGK